MCDVTIDETTITAVSMTGITEILHCHPGTSYAYRSNPSSPYIKVAAHGKSAQKAVKDEVGQDHDFLIRSIDLSGNKSSRLIVRFKNKLVALEFASTLEHIWGADKCPASLGVPR